MLEYYYYYLSSVANVLAVVGCWFSMFFVAVNFQYIVIFSLANFAAAERFDCQDVLRQEVASSMIACVGRCKEAVRVTNIDCCGVVFEKSYDETHVGQCSQYWRGPRRRLRSDQMLQHVNTSSRDQEVVDGYENPEVEMANRFLQFGWKELQLVQFGVSVANLSPQAKKVLALAQQGMLPHIGMSVVRLAASCADPNTPASMLLSPGMALDPHLTRDLVWGSDGSVIDLVKSAWGNAVFGVLSDCAGLVTNHVQHTKSTDKIFLEFNKPLRSSGVIKDDIQLGDVSTCSAEKGVALLSRAWKLLSSNPLRVTKHGAELDLHVVSDAIEEADQVLRCAEKKDRDTDSDMFSPAWFVCWELLSQIAAAVRHDSYNKNVLAKDNIILEQLSGSDWPPKFAFGDSGLLTTFKVVQRPLATAGDTVFPSGRVSIFDESREDAVDGKVVVLATSVLHDRSASGRVDLEFLVYAHYDDPRFSYGREVCAAHGKVDDCEKGGLYRANTIAASNFWLFSCQFANGITTPATVYSRVSMYSGAYAHKRDDPPNDRRLFPDEDDDYARVPSLRV
eukprot:gene462-157_t